MVSYPYEQLFLDDSVDKQISITSDDHTLNVTNDTLIQGEFELVESLCSEETLHFGACETTQLTFTCLTNAPSLVDKWITVEITPSGGTPFRIERFRVHSDKYTQQHKYRKIVAYDKLFYYCPKSYKVWYHNMWQSAEDTITFKQFRDGFFERVNIDQETVTLPIDSIPIKRQKLSKITGKDIMSCMCECLGAFGHMGRDHLFHYWFLPIDTDTPQTMSNTYVISVDHEDYIVQNIDRLEILDNEGNLRLGFGESAEDAINPYTIQNNFLMDGMDDEHLAVVGQILFAYISKISYVPLIGADCKGNPCKEVGDMVTFTDSYSTIRTYILERRMKGSQAIRDEYCAEGQEFYPDEGGGNSINAKINNLQQQINAIVNSGGGGGGGGGTSGNFNALLVNNFQLVDYSQVNS